MNRRYFTQIANWLRHSSRPRPSAAAMALAALTLFAGGLLWRKSGTDCRPLAVQAKLADAPSWEAGRRNVETACRSFQRPTGRRCGCCYCRAGDFAMPGANRRRAAVSGRRTRRSSYVLQAGPELLAPQGRGRCSQPAGRKPVRRASLQLPPAQHSPPRMTLVLPLTVLPQAAATFSPQPVRSEAMEMIARQSDQKIRHGFELADRGA